MNDAMIMKDSKMEMDSKMVMDSKMRIMNALLDLMQVKELKTITVSEITENAEVGRKTFYRHFSSKEEVLDAYWQLVFQQIMMRLEKLKDTFSLTDSLGIILASCSEHRDFLYALCRNQMQSFLLDEWNQKLPGLHAHFLNRIVKFPKTESEEELEYLLAFNAGGVFNIVMKWISDGMKDSPEHLAEMIKKMVMRNWS